MREELLPTTEKRNPRTQAIDLLGTESIMRVMHEEDKLMLEAVDSQIPRIAQAVDLIVAAMSAGGRLFYLGAGTSGRLGVLDASEVLPTFNVNPSLIQGLIAGGDVALRHAVEGAEDNEALAVEDLKKKNFKAGDVLVGLAASGRTPYVLGGLHYAKSLGARAIGVSCVEGSAIEPLVDVAIVPVVGPEVITGSTRLKAGTATKLVLNMLSTGTMIRLGYVYGNLMVNVQATNHKLEERTLRILQILTELPAAHVASLLHEAGDIKTAVVMHRRHLSREEASLLLENASGNLRKALI